MRRDSGEGIQKNKKKLDSSQSPKYFIKAALHVKLSKILGVFF
jgi:hypothetical protein